MSDAASPVAATAIGALAVLLWSSLALLTAFAAAIPPFELLALSFGIAFLAGTTLIGLKGGGFRSWRQPWPVWLTAFAGLFFYHALYFFALETAPPAQASLTAYLWPLLIVLFSALVAQEPLGWRQLAGAGLGLAGTALLVLRRDGPDSTGSAPLAGLAAAFGCALVWSVYSVVNRRFRGTPSDMMAGVCGLVALAGLACHLLFESTVMPDRNAWLALAALGIGPVGAAFFAWDHATKHGRLAVLGAISYAAPLLSTLLLVACGRASPTVTLAGAATLIVAGAAIATR